MLSPTSSHNNKITQGPPTDTGPQTRSPADMLTFWLGLVSIVKHLQMPGGLRDQRYAMQCGCNCSTWF